MSAQYFLVEREVVYIVKVYHLAMLEFLRKEYDENVEILESESIAVGYKQKFLFLGTIIKFFLAAVICFLVTGSLIGLKFEKVEVGRYIWASSLRTKSPRKHSLSVKFKILRNLLKSVKMIWLAKKYYSKASFAYIHDTPYLKGIIVDYLLGKGTKVFVSAYPFHLALFGGQLLQQQSIHKLAYGMGEASEANAISYMFGRLSDPSEILDYYKSEKKIANFVRQDQESSVILYCNAFTDAQLKKGFSGFFGVHDWLISTIRFLKKQGRRVYVKPHPNFYYMRESPVRFWDREIYTKIKHRFQDSETIFLEEDINNKEFLSEFSVGNTWVVSHHSNAIIEAAFLGFRTLSSKASLWDEEYQFGEVWTTRNDYFHRLAMGPREYDVSRAEAMRFVKDFYLQPNGVATKDHFKACILRSLKPHYKWLSDAPSQIRKNHLSNEKVLISELANSLRVFSIND